MKKSCVFFLLFCIQIPSIAQQHCGAPLLGEFFYRLKAIKGVRHEVKEFKRYNSFNFHDFKPSNEKALDSAYIEVGCDQKGTIVELIFRQLRNEGRFTYAMMIHDFPEYRIILIKRNVGKDLNNEGMNNFEYTPVAILNSKDTDDNYMINVVSQFKDTHLDHASFEEFPIKNFNDISCIMKLDENLYPNHMLKISNGQVVSYSSFFNYRGTDQLKYELLRFFIDQPNFYPDMKKVTENTCLKEFIATIDNIEPNWELTVRPKIYGQKDIPLWVFNGAHQYEICPIK